MKTKGVLALVLTGAAAAVTSPAGSPWLALGAAAATAAALLPSAELLAGRSGAAPVANAAFLTGE